MYKKLADDTARRVTILNSDNHTRFEFYVYDRRLAHLTQLVQESKSDPIPESWGWGVDSSAVLGMNVIFDSIPMKFPLQDLLIWLRDEIDPDLSLSTVEQTLIKLARLYEL
jgi:hypothetical protein